jgi:sterol desaturase/sphingolipid hydroxylase (fatty acid hydroxylase superfamily)
MNAEDIVGLMIPLTWFVMMAVEALGTGRAWPQVRWWRTRHFAFFVMLMTINALLPGLLPPEWAARHLVDGARLGVAGGVVVGFAVLTFANAMLHRTYHHFDLLWRWVHQLHHSAIRLDAASAVLFTPQEIVLNVTMFQIVVVFVLGLDPLAAAILGYIAAFYGLFQHFNIRTPQWLGYLIQRPESHAVHHRRGFHGYNYSDFPPWDVLMGTFRNPREFKGAVGFEGEAVPALVPMLVGRDANVSAYGRGNRGSRDPLANPA